MDNLVPTCHSPSMLIDLPDASPRMHDLAWVAPGAVLIGDVELDEQASVWYGSVVRGDGDRISIGPRTNLQDGTIVHSDPGRPVRIGRGVTIGHRAVLHGCTIEDDCLIGMGAIVLNNASIGTGSVIGAGALITEGMEVPPGSLVLGAPGRLRRQTLREERERIVENAATYVRLMTMHRDAQG